MSSNISQYFNVVISSPKQAKGAPVSWDATQYIEDGLKLTDEDGLIKECTFDMNEGFMMLDILAIGMGVSLIGGDLAKNKLLFTGEIKTITPDFRADGNVYLRVIANSQEGGRCGSLIRDLVYPSKNHPKTWARQNITYSDIIINLAKDAGITVNYANIKVIKQVTAQFGQGTVRQKSLTDWAFMQFLAGHINCTLWTEETSGKSVLHLMDNGTVVNRLAQKTFFFPARTCKSEFADFTHTSDRQVRLIEVKINLDTQNTKGKFKTAVDPKTGDTKVTTEQKATDEKGNEITEKWVLDEKKVQALSMEERNTLIELFMSGKITWEGDGAGTVSAKEYFIKVDLTTGSSRDGEQANTETSIQQGALKDDGVATQDATTQSTGSKTYKTVIDEAKLGSMSSEKRSSIMGRIARGEMTDGDRDFYTVVDTTPKVSAEDLPKAGGQDTKAGVDKSATAKASVTNPERGKRDAGFNITGKAYGDLDVVPRFSYIVEGLGKYSDKYYLYKITHEWGRSGYLMDFVFVK